MKRLLGLREFPKKSKEEKKAILGSDQRVMALDSISTSTNPRSKREVKKGIVLETVEKELIPPDTLKHHPIVYIGSGIDVEYPLALGGRHILMVDPFLADENAKKEILQNLEKLAGTVSNIAETIEFKFDFGEGLEDVKVHMIAKPYPYSEKQRKDTDYVIPMDAAAILSYAPEGISFDTDLLREKLSDGGVLIHEYILTNKDGTDIELGG
jgi:hypothetical protein